MGTILEFPSLKLIMCKGLPGSGKSYWAAQQDGYAVVNKDDIRKELAATGWVWSHKTEKKDVIPARDRLIYGFLGTGGSVISSDTNLAPEHEKQLRDIATRTGAEFEVKDFTDVPLDVCIQRDSKRSEGRVGQDVILSMYYKYLMATYEPNRLLPSAIICDLDGTLALFEGLRGPYEHEKCADDRLNKPIYDIIKVFSDRHVTVVYVSGREDKFRQETVEFLVRNNCPDGPLFMRITGDNRNDAIVKLELFNNNIRGNYNIQFVLDDRDRVVKMWRALGLTCLQVAEGDF